MMSSSKKELHLWPSYAKDIVFTLLCVALRYENKFQMKVQHALEEIIQKLSQAFVKLVQGNLSCLSNGDSAVKHIVLLVSDEYSDSRSTGRK